jgi:death-on-curing protein
MVLVMNYLSRDDILDLHGYVVERYGGRLGFNSHDRLVSLIAAPSLTMFGEQLYSDLPAKMAAVTFALIKNRPFRSGNEATALLAALRFAAINNHQIDDVVALSAELLATSRSERTQDTLVDWLTDHLLPTGATPAE